MSTISDRKIVDAIIKGDGYYEDDLVRVYSIWEYTSKWDTHCYKLMYAPNMRLETTEFVRNPKLLWSATSDKRMGGFMDRIEEPMERELPGEEP